ncbi:recombinase family protein [Endozoicomonas gorgoniicola]|uniref:Recombinase family protein n=1 Tax=Endozoicomonas gorgoniicola TaxID=1234144 RepID=A0ABT3MQX5_9GAMM|nr:recombinase family protein [Endozoicomonas gorgoniicola]MCW7551762.1 recombinase family protein [Endozoicomonas gorgoniicola]
MPTTKNTLVKKRCAIYTRKSSEEGLEQEFNSLHAQRDAAEAYIHSQKHEGWVLVPDDYNDGGFSGGNVERPALQRLLRDVQAGLVDIVVVYKVDRLSRSLADFAQLVDLFDKNNVSFVSVTQQFNTTSSMGRLTLNILLSFSQFEREVTSERIRDKFLLSKKKGMWMGGNPPLGYDVNERKLIINPAEAEIVKLIFKTFVKTRSIIATCEVVNEQGHKTKQIPLRDGGSRGGIEFAKNTIHRILKNRIYIGEIGNKGQWYPGEHKPIITMDLWAKAHGTFDVHASLRSRESRHRKNPSFLRGLLFGHDGHALTTSSTRRNGQQFRYYVSRTAQAKGYKNASLPPLSATAVENLILEETRKRLTSPELLFKVWQQASEVDKTISEDIIRTALNDLASIWDELFAPEKRRLVELLIKRIELDLNQVTIYYQPDGINAVTQELQGAR